MSDANYNGKQPSNTSYIKTFIEGSPFNVWVVDPVTFTNDNLKVVTLAAPLKDVYIPGNLYITGNVIHYDPKPKTLTSQTITSPITVEQSNAILTIPVVQVEDLDSKKTSFNIDVNYSELSTMEIMPLLIRKIQDLQEQVTHLSNLLNHESL